MNRLHSIRWCLAAIALVATCLTAQAGEPASQPATTASAPAAPAAARGPQAWSLPKGMIVEAASLAVTADGRYATFGQVVATPDAAEDRRPAQVVCWLSESATGKMTQLTDLLAKEPDAKDLVVRQVTLSPTKDLACMIAVASDSSLHAFVVDLSSLKVQKIATAPLVLAAWAGENLLITEYSREKGLSPIRLFKPFSGQSVALPIRAACIAATMDGKVLIVGGNPKTLTSANGKESMDQAGKLLAINPDGKVLAELASLESLNSGVVVSPNGKFAAFQHRGSGKSPASPGAGRDGISIRVVPLAGGEGWTISKSGVPLRVLDAGQVLAVVTGSDSAGETLKLYDSDGNALPFPSALAGTIVNGRVYSIAPGDQPVIKSSPLKADKSAGSGK